MTLTQELDRSDSRVRKFIDACFVIGPAEVRRAMPQADRTRLNTMLLPPPEEISPGGLGTVGTAFDYRVRFVLEGLPARPLAAHRGAALLAGRCEARLSGDRVERIDTNASPVYGLPRSPGVSTKLVRQFFTEFERLTAGSDALARKDADDTTVAQYCLTLALFEEVYRAAGSPYFDSPLLYLRRGATLDNLLSLVSPAQVFDVNQLWRGFSGEVGTGAKRVIGNPEFAGGGDIGGADADLLLDDCLVELKASKRPPVLAQVLRQLMGYVLLDYEDEYSIRSVAVYAARQRAFLKFTLHELLLEHVSSDDGLIITTTYDGEAATVEARLIELRATFRRLLRRRR